MSNQPKKKKKRTFQRTRPVEPFDNYEQFEKTLDDIIQLLNAQSALSTITSHDDEIDLIEDYLIEHFGNNVRTCQKMEEVMLSLSAIAQRDSATRE